MIEEKKKRGRPKKIVDESIVPVEKTPKKKGRPSRIDRLRAIESEFNLTETMVDDFNQVACEVEIIDSKVHEIEKSNNDVLINVDRLKEDFSLVRDNIIKLVSTGQKILGSACELDISDLKASQLDALSNLQSTLGNNIKLLLDCYKTMADIEKNKVSKITENPKSINNGSVQNNNILFQGSSSDLLKALQENI